MGQVLDSGLGAIGDRHFAHAPPLLKLGDIAKSSIRNRTHIRDDKQICHVGALLQLSASVRGSVSVLLCARSINTWVTDPRAQPLKSNFTQS